MYTQDDNLANEIPDEEMTAFLEKTLSTLQAHRADIEGLIKVCHQYNSILLPD